MYFNRQIDAWSKLGWNITVQQRLGFSKLSANYGNSYFLFRHLRVSNYCKRKEFILISKIKSTQNILSLFYPDLQQGIGIACYFSCQSCFSLTGWPQMIKCQTILLAWEQTKMQSFNICPQSGHKVRQEPDHKTNLLLTCDPTHFAAGSVFSKVCSNCKY